MLAVRIPRADLDVSSICLGTSDFGTAIDRATAFALLDAFADRGGTFVDTAHVYGDWVKGAERSASERTIGAWLAERRARDRIVLATKGAHPILGSSGAPRVTPADVVADLDASLRILGTDRIDLYWLHRDDPRQPVGEVLETLEGQVRLGKIRDYGASNWGPTRLREADRYAASASLAGFCADQSLWNAAILKPEGFGDVGMLWMEDERFAYHLETGLPMIAYQSQAHGIFHRMRAGTLDHVKPSILSPYDLDATERRFERIREVMAGTGLTLTQVVLGYLRSQPFFTIPIVGPRSVEQLVDSLSAAAIQLSPEEVRYVETGRRDWLSG